LSMFDSDQRLIMCNPAYRELYCLPEEATRAGVCFSDIEAGVVRCRGREGLEGAPRPVSADYLLKLGCGQSFSETTVLVDGRTIIKKVGPIAGGGWVDVQEDVTDRVQQEAQIAHMARHDALTGLPNRAHLLEALDRALQKPPTEQRVVVLFIDLDRFKQVNDTLGHLMGDDLLKAVARRLRDTVREDDLVARLGGDEFVVMQLTSEPTRQAAELANRIIASLVAPFHIAGRRLDIGASVGIAIAPQGGADAAGLLSRADAALYQTKAAGGTGYCVSGHEHEEHRALVVYSIEAPKALSA
jgi:diguanylate cyclase (GGDEF)-like protein